MHSLHERAPPELVLDRVLGEPDDCRINQVEPLSSDHAKKEALLSDLGSASFPIKYKEKMARSTVTECSDPLGPAVRTWRTPHSEGQAEENEAFWSVLLQEGHSFVWLVFSAPQAPSCTSSQVGYAYMTLKTRKNPRTREAFRRAAE